MSALDCSEDEETGNSSSPFHIDWLPLPTIDQAAALAISALPGCRFRTVWRNLDDDIRSLQDSKIQEVFVLCTNGELVKYRVPTLLTAYGNIGMVVHYWPTPDGTVPAMDDLLHLLQDLQLALNSGSKALIHCYGGLGRACLVAACLMLQKDDSLQPEVVIERLRQLRGPSAIQTVKQYNFIMDFRRLRDEYLKKALHDSPRSLSR